MARCVPRAPQRVVSTIDSARNVSRGLENSSNMILGPWQPGQLKERAGFLGSRSLTLPAALEPQALFDDFPRAPKKRYL